MKIFRWNNGLASKRGVSLPIAIALVVLLMTATASVNQLILKTLRSVNQIEASNRAYMAAEAGVEDALYELSAHFAGYETPALNSADEDPIRQAYFGSKNDVRWENRWTIRSHDFKNVDCASDLCGQLNQRRKLTVSLFNDQSVLPTTEANKAVTDHLNLINSTSPVIKTFGISDFDIAISVPATIIESNTDTTVAFVDGLLIDNDGDAFITTKNNGVNEDGQNDSGICAGDPDLSKDADCDQREDEDSAQDPVIYWKISDGTGKTLTPKKGCINETDAAKKGSNLCEADFQYEGNALSVHLTGANVGINDQGEEQGIGNFLSQYNENDSKKLQMEFLVVAPLEQVDIVNQRKIPIPYLDYEIEYSATAGETISEPYFVIQSDGYYRDFKQSITTTLTPKTAVPLLDFTVIQQQ